MQRQRDAKQNFEAQLLIKCQEEVAADNAKIEMLKAKVLQDKIVRDIEMEKTLNDKQQRLRKQMIDESEYLKKVKRDIEEDKLKDMAKKTRTGQEVALVLLDNAEQDKRKEVIRQKDVVEDIRLAEYRKNLEIANEERRKRELEARAAKVGNTMAQHANTVIKKQEEQDLINAQKLKKHIEDKKRSDEENEQRKREQFDQSLS